MLLCIAILKILEFFWAFDSIKLIWLARFYLEDFNRLSLAFPKKILLFKDPKNQVLLVNSHKVYTEPIIDTPVHSQRYVVGED